MTEAKQKTKAKPEVKDEPKAVPVVEAPKAQSVKTVKVRAKWPPFIDQITARSIGLEPVEVELHPWLQAQIDAGFLIED